MNREDVNNMVARAAGIDVRTTEQVLVGLEKVINAEIAASGVNKFGRVISLYQVWKGK